MRFIKLLLFVFISIVSVAAANAQTAKCLSYEPKKVSLRGHLLRKSVVNASNQKETIWTIKLDAPICVKADAGNEFNVAVKRLTDVQLVLSSEQFKKYRANLNKKIEAGGTLFGAHTQHHFTNVLMIVEEIKAR
ncbi:MAG TPA: DUF4431 domain-containing protein [Pyrinomonadaceae bacterium]|jgi:hypothetical protein